MEIGKKWTSKKGGNANYDSTINNYLSGMRT